VFLKQICKEISSTIFTTSYLFPLSLEGYKYSYFFTIRLTTGNLTVVKLDPVSSKASVSPTP
jgi:hypothetical protein